MRQESSMSSPQLNSKIALITGGASGIGAVTATVFAARGARVIIGDIDEHTGQKVADQIKGDGAEALFVATDVTSAHEVARLVAVAVERFGRLDCAFNNAGTDGLGTTLHECTEENWDHVHQVNLKGAWLCMKYELGQMLQQGHGSIVNMSSAAGTTGFARGLGAYVAAKHGVVGLTRAAALEYATTGIRINALCPGAVRTPMLDEAIQQGVLTREAADSWNPVHRLAEPLEIAEAAAWLCSDAASFVSGHAMAVDGGLTAGVPAK
jgi:NAD(P)-dependent dehydrogenase (short-subunit alcohol dehydrogenase family)